MKDKSFHDYSMNFWPSWADFLLTVLLMLILYVFVQFVSFSSATIDELVNVRKAQEEMEQKIKHEFRNDYLNLIKILRDANLQRITFSDRILFDLARAELKTEGKEVLGRLGNILRENPYYKKIQVEGHTDDLPLHPGGPFPSNWELSSARATSVVRFLQESSNIAPNLLSASGYSEYQAVVPNVDVQSRSLNRRVEIVLVYTTHEKAELLP
ncbi:OmpA/MotB family protein [Desulfobacca acetoxidans]